MARATAAVTKKASKTTKSAKSMALPPEVLFRKRLMVLTDRERAVLKFFARGHTYQEIGKRLNISPKTVGSYLQRVREKVRAKNRSDLITLAIKEDLIKEK